MTTICRRLHRGDDLLLSIKSICRENHIAAGVILSGVGCLTALCCGMPTALPSAPWRSTARSCP